MSEVSFEQAQAELEQIVERLERGEELYRRCANQLSAAQGKIEELAKRLQEGEPEA